MEKTLSFVGYGNFNNFVLFSFLEALIDYYKSFDLHRDKGKL